MCGKHDIIIFKEKLKGILEEDEMVEVDRGYTGLCEFILTNFDYESAQEGMAKSELWSRHEFVDRSFKSLGILQQAFRSDRKRHKFVFYAISIMTQMSIDNGNVLFSCKPNTRKKAFYHIQEIYYIYIYIIGMNYSELKLMLICFVQIYNIICMKLRSTRLKDALLLY